MTEWDEVKKDTMMIYGPVILPPLGKLIAEGDRLQKVVMVKEELLETGRSIIYEQGQKLEAIREHLKTYPDEKDDEKYSFSGDIGPKFNSVLFLTHLEIWKKEFDEILGDEE